MNATDKITKGEFARYLGVSKNTATKYYRMYLCRALRPPGSMLSYADVAMIDNIQVGDVLARVFPKNPTIPKIPNTVKR